MGPIIMTASIKNLIKGSKKAKKLIISTHLNSSTTNNLDRESGTIIETSWENLLIAFDLSSSFT